MVVGIHVVGANNYTDPKSVQWIICNVCDLALWGCVPIFFMISGAILFEKNVNHTIFLKKIMYILKIWLLTSFLYVFLDMGVTYAIYGLKINRITSIREVFLILKYIGGNLNEFLKLWCKGFYHLWYLPAMIMFYIMVPLVRNILYGEKLSIKYFMAIVIYIILQKNVLVNYIQKNECISLLVSRFDATFFAYILYGIIGYLMQKRKYRKKDYLLCVTIYIICVMAAFIIRKQEFISTGIFFDKQAYWGITSVIESICIFIFFNSLKKKAVLLLEKFPNVRLEYI